MTFRIDIETDNDAFRGASLRPELYRILRNIALRVKVGEDGGKVMDSNGNSVGAWTLDLAQLDVVKRDPKGWGAGDDEEERAVIVITEPARGTSVQITGYTAFVAYIKEHHGAMWQDITDEHGEEPTLRDAATTFEELSGDTVQVLDITRRVP